MRSVIKESERGVNFISSVLMNRKEWLTLEVDDRRCLIQQVWAEIYLIEL